MEPPRRGRVRCRDRPITATRRSNTARETLHQDDFLSRPSTLEPNRVERINRSPAQGGRSCGAIRTRAAELTAHFTRPQWARPGATPGAGIASTRERRPPRQTTGPVCAGGPRRPKNETLAFKSGRPDRLASNGARWSIPAAGRGRPVSTCKMQGPASNTRAWSLEGAPADSFHPRVRMPSVCESRRQRGVRQ